MSRISVLLLISLLSVSMMSCMKGIGLLQACIHGQTERVKKLLDEGVDPNFRDPIRGDFPLLIAQIHGHEDITKLLVQRDADVNQIDRSGRSSLMMAAHHGRLKQVQFLLESGAIIDLKDEDGDSALDLAIEKRHVEIADLLRRKSEVN
ncbi:MAG: ankyrin repeat domain-containing protein [Nitrospirota bacterium]